MFFFFKSSFQCVFLWLSFVQPFFCLRYPFKTKWHYCSAAFFWSTSSVIFAHKPQHGLLEITTAKLTVNVWVSALKRLDLTAVDDHSTPGTMLKSKALSHFVTKQSEEVLTKRRTVTRSGAALMGIILCLLSSTQPIRVRAGLFSRIFRCNVDIDACGEV